MHFSGVSGRFSTLSVDDILWHFLLGQILTCHCGLAFPSVQHLGMYWRICRMSPASPETETE
jgi:hypothetical protein